MGYCMTTHHDTGASMSPQPPQDGRWATFAPAILEKKGRAGAQAAGASCTSCRSGPGAPPVPAAALALFFIHNNFELVS
jgi:hypothetical protein